MRRRRHRKAFGPAWLALLASTGLSEPAPAQSGSPDQNVVCSSRDNRRTQCRVPFTGRAHLLQNLSDTRCVEGRNWGSGRGMVWVDQGCRGRFGPARTGGAIGDGRTIRCESNDMRRHTCHTGWRSAALVRQLSDSRCVQGRSWGSRDGEVWVNDGCRAEFREGGWGGGHSGGSTVRCQSQSNRRQTCPTSWRSAVLVRQLSGTRCVEGHNWGSRSGEVWVDDGCRAEFAEGRGGGHRDRYSITCSSRENRRQSCAWDTRRGIPQLVEQLSGSRCEHGRSWGYTRGAVWVSNGCRARFAAR